VQYKCVLLTQNQARTLPLGCFKAFWSSCGTENFKTHGAGDLNRRCPHTATCAAAWLVVAAICIYLIAYRFYGLWVANRALGVDGTLLSGHKERPYAFGKRSPAAFDLSQNAHCRTRVQFRQRGLFPPFRKRAFTGSG